MSDLTSVPTFDELVANLPDRQKDTMPAARAATGRLSEGDLEPLRGAAAIQPQSIRGVLAHWTGNNNDLKIVEKKPSPDELLAQFATAYPRYREVMKDDDFRNWAERKAAVATEALCALNASWGFTQGLVTPVLARGGAMRTRDFDAEYFEGNTVTWDTPTATTVEPEFVPLHFARINREYAITALQMVPSELTTYVLRISVPAALKVPGYWVAEIEPKNKDNDTRWQAEIVTAPGLKLKVTSVNDSQQRWGRFCRIEGVLLPYQAL